MQIPNMIALTIKKRVIEIFLKLFGIEIVLKIMINCVIRQIEILFIFLYELYDRIAKAAIRASIL